MNRDSSVPTDGYQPQEIGIQENMFRLYEQMLGDIDIVNVLQNTTKAVAQLLNAERATTYLVRQDSQELESVAIIGNVARTIRIPINENSLSGYCASSRRSLEM